LSIQFNDSQLSRKLISAFVDVGFSPCNDGRWRGEFVMRLLLRQGRSEAEPGLRRRATPAATLGCTPRATSAARRAGRASCTPRATLVARYGVGRGAGLGGNVGMGCKGKGRGLGLFISHFSIFSLFLLFLFSLIIFIHRKSYKLNEYLP
jgi:hypothetical protein